MTRVIEVTRRGRRGADGQSNLTGVTALSADYMLSNDDSGKAFRCTAPLTLTIPSSLAAGWSIYVDADGANVTLATDTTINGVSSLVVTSGNSAFVYSDGTNHYARFFVSSAIASIAASGVGFAPITGNSATDVQAAITVNTGLWNAVTTYGKSLIAAATAAAARTVLELKAGALSEKAIQAEAEAGTDDAKFMTALQVAYAMSNRGSPPEFTSSAQAVTLGTKLSVAHGLAAVPKNVEVILRCKTADAPYVVGEEVEAPSFYDTSGQYYNVQFSQNATNVLIRTGANAVYLSTDDGTGRMSITPANWEYIVRAWK